MSLNEKIRIGKGNDSIGDVDIFFLPGDKYAHPLLVFERNGKQVGTFGLHDIPELASNLVKQGTNHRGI